MSILAASSMEIGAHPATVLLLGGLVASILRGRSASIALVVAPVLGFWHVHTLELGSVSHYWGRG